MARGGQLKEGGVTVVPPVPGRQGQPEEDTHAYSCCWSRKAEGRDRDFGEGLGQVPSQGSQGVPQEEGSMVIEILSSFWISVPSKCQNLSGVQAANVPTGHPSQDVHCEYGFTQASRKGVPAIIQGDRRLGSPGRALGAGPC